MDASHSAVRIITVLSNHIFNFLMSAKTAHTYVPTHHGPVGQDLVIDSVP